MFGPRQKAPLAPLEEASECMLRVSADLHLICVWPDIQSHQHHTDTHWAIQLKHSSMLAPTGTQPKSEWNVQNSILEHKRLSTATNHRTKGLIGPRKHLLGLVLSDACTSLSEYAMRIGRNVWSITALVWRFTVKVRFSQRENYPFAIIGQIPVSEEHIVSGQTSGI